MKSPAVGYFCAKTIEEAVGFLAEHEESKVLAGGQSLVTSLNMRLAAPQYLVDINRIEALSHLKRQGDEIVVGALVRHIQVANSPLIAEHVPLVAMAMDHVAHPAIRNRGTTCGSLAYADPAAEMPCCAVTLNATLVLRSKAGERVVAARDFFHGLYETERHEDELLVEVRFPVAKPHEHFGFDEVAQRHGDFALVGVAVRAECLDRRIDALDLVIFASVPNPVISQDAAQLAIGQDWSPDLVEAVARAVAVEIEPMENLQGRPETKRRQAAALIRRVLTRMMAEVVRGTD